MGSKANRPTFNAIAYDELVPKLRTGDVVVFHGVSFASRAIERVTGSRYSHAAMIYRPDPDGPPMLWETGPDPIVEDPRTRSRHGGAQLGYLDQALRTMNRPAFGDTPYVRQLEFERTDEFERMASQVVQELEGRPFPSLLQMAGDWLAGQLHFVTTDKRMYCAELVAATFMRLGLLPFDPPDNFYDPKDFSVEYDRVPWQRGARLGPQYQIVGLEARRGHA